MKKWFCQFMALVMLSVMLLSILTACGAKSRRVAIEVEGYGTIVIKLKPGEAPITVKNFQKLVAEGFYDGLTFHRIADLTGKGGYIIQGGDPKGDGTGGSEETIKGEFAENGVRNTLSHTRGTVSMARSDKPDSASSQFFICAGDCTFLDGSYAAFAEVVEGMDVVDRLAAVEVNASKKPLTPVVITRVYFD